MQTASHAIDQQRSQRVSSQPSHWMRIGDHIALPATSASFDRNEEIYGEGEDAIYVYKIVAGAVRTVRFLEDGRRQVAAFHLPGDIFGLEGGDMHRFTAEAIAPTEVVLVKRSILEKAVATDAAAVRQLWALTSAQLVQVQDQLLLLGRKSAVERVSAFLLEMSHRESEATTIELPMSRIDIADYLGLTIETVSRTLTQLERSNTIALPSSRHIVLRDQDALTMLDS